jgi:hypothetical protein
MVVVVVVVSKMALSTVYFFLGPLGLLQVMLDVCEAKFPAVQSRVLAEHDFHCNTAIQTPHQTVRHPVCGVPTATTSAICRQHVYEIP